MARFDLAPDEPVDLGADAEGPAGPRRSVPEAMDLRGLARARPRRLSTFALTSQAPSTPAPSAPAAPPSATGRRHGPTASAQVVRVPPPPAPVPRAASPPPAAPLAALPVPAAVAYPPPAGPEPLDDPPPVAHPAAEAHRPAVTHRGTPAYAPAVDEPALMAYPGAPAYAPAVDEPPLMSYPGGPACAPAVDEPALVAYPGAPAYAPAVDEPAAEPYPPPGAEPARPAWPPHATSSGTVIMPPPSRPARPVGPPAGTVIAGAVLASTAVPAPQAAVGPLDRVPAQHADVPPQPRRQPGPMPVLPRPERRRPDPAAGGRAAPGGSSGPRRQVGLDPAVVKVLTALGLITAYIAICLSPLAIVSIGHHVPRRPFLVEFSVALGYVGLAMMVLQFTLVSRIKWLARPFGIDVLQRFHRQVSFVALTFVFAHPILLLVQSAPTYLPLFDVRTAPWRARYGVAACAALLLVVFVSIWRRKLRLPYEVWKLSHGLLSTSVMFLALAHMVGVNRFTGGTGGRVVVLLVGVAIVAILGWSRLVAPRVHLFKQWRVVEVIRERGRAVTLVVEPVRHPGWSFMPGQFAWVTVGGTPFKVDQHPFSLSSPGDVEEGGRIHLTIKERGNWTRGIGSIKPGTRVYLDGPYGAFSIDMNQAPGYVFIAGGVGITPMFSMISTMCMREDTRPAILFYANPDWDSITFREQLDELSTYMTNLRVVHVLKSPPPGWRGETGRITTAVLERSLPRQHQSFVYFVCAAEAMMDEVEGMLLELGVPDYRIHAERFGMV